MEKFTILTSFLGRKLGLKSSVSLTCDLMFVGSGICCTVPAARRRLLLFQSMHRAGAAHLCSS